MHAITNRQVTLIFLPLLVSFSLCDIFHEQVTTILHFELELWRRAISPCSQPVLPWVWHLLLTTSSSCERHCCRWVLIHFTSRSGFCILWGFLSTFYVLRWHHLEWPKSSQWCAELAPMRTPSRRRSLPTWSVVNGKMPLLVCVSCVSQPTCACHVQTNQRGGVPLEADSPEMKTALFNQVCGDYVWEIRASPGQALLKKSAKVRACKSGIKWGTSR